MRWQDCLEHLQPGNILVVTDLTRLGGSTADLSDIVTVLGRRGIGFRSLAEPWLDTTSAYGKLIFDMFASLAEYEPVVRTHEGRVSGRESQGTPRRTSAGDDGDETCGGQRSAASGKETAGDR
ncbi:recombinase family protein [Arthrobacter sp. Leaf337]|uniref:recombinase family protein n=1 Tax=Arthrobacter sp. Leaf337 TaxID=1736342 RepID=UPI002E14B206